MFDCSWNKRQSNVVSCEDHKCIRITHVNCVGTAPFSNISGSFRMFWVTSLVNLSDGWIFWDSWTLWNTIILKCTYSWANWNFHTHFRGYYCTWSVISFEINQVLIRSSSEMLSVQTVHSEPVSTISSYMYILSANCSYSYESNNYYGSNKVLQLLVFQSNVIIVTV